MAVEKKRKNHSWRHKRMKIRKCAGAEEYIDWKRYWNG